MKRLNKKQTILITAIFISLINIFLFSIFFYNILKKENKKENILFETYDINFKENEYYIGLNETLNIELDNNKIKHTLLIDNENIATINNNKVTGMNFGNTEIILLLPDNTIKTAKIYVVKGIVAKPKEFDYSKSYITCNHFSNEENKLIDKALESKINNVKYKTRASAVEAARFLTLNFEFRIPYFYENGRLNNYGGKEYVDGEGRYYHKGLYLSESKYSELKSSLYGPTSWGCPLVNITKSHSYGYYVGQKYPNGLDCSGFISWALLNGGFDVKDTGAGETYREDDLYDLGEKTPITLDLLNSKKIKVGDLIAYSGHMAMIIGMENDNIYVAETLPHLKGVVAKKYTKVQAKNTFTHIMLMDSVYKEDGNLTNMWY